MFPQATDMSMPAGEDVVPTDVLVVMRVSGPRGSQKLQAYVDPLACFAHKIFRIRSELVCAPCDPV